MLKYLQKISLDWQYYVASVVTTMCGCLLYYFGRVIRKPKLIGAEGEFKSDLIRELDVLRHNFVPTFWAFNAHLQTICSVLFREDPVLPYYREMLSLPDNGQVGIDWVFSKENNSAYPDSNKRPTLVIVPGITGDSDAGYVKNLIVEAKSMGWRSVVFNNRGLGNVKLKTPRAFCAVNTEDLEFVLEHISTKYPQSPLLLFAVSLGGMVVTNYIAKVGKPKTNVIGALVVSVTWDSFKSTASLEKPLNWLLYNRGLANNLVNLVKENLAVFEEHADELPYRVEDVLKATTIREFDTEFTSKTFGFATNDEYYTASSLTLKSLETIQIPMLFLNAHDDPFVPGESIPIEEIKKNPNIALILTDYGGHVGFLEGSTVNSRALVERLFNQYATYLMKKNEQLWSRQHVY